MDNNRVVAKADGTIVQTNHYYPYGMSFAESTQTSNQSYKYNGKELDLEYGLNWHDYEARMKDVHSFTTIDPLAEKYYSWSPYAYCGNNPITRIDPDGRDWYQHNETQNYSWYDGDGEREGYPSIGAKGSVLGEFEIIRFIHSRHIKCDYLGMIKVGEKGKTTYVLNESVLLLLR